MENYNKDEALKYLVKNRTDFDEWYNYNALESKNRGL